MRKRTIIKGTLILTFAGLITRTLGFVNRIYLSNLIGAEGIGLYQLIFPVYMVCYTICCSGLLTAITRLTAEENAKKNHGNIKKMMRIATTISFSIAVVLAGFLYFESDWISIKIIGEPRIELGLKIAALSIPFTAVAQCIKGYFYGVNKTALPAITQVTEQVIRITLIYYLSSYFVPKGLSYACLVAVIGMIAGEISSCILVFLVYEAKSVKIAMEKATKTYRFFARKVGAIALPLTTNRLITTLLSSIETVLIPAQLKLFGYSHGYSMSIFGTLTGMAMPLIYFPTIVTSSASMVLLPAISEANASKQKGIISNTVSKTLKFTILIGIVFMFYFLFFGNALGMIIYHEPYVGELLFILSFLCPFFYLQTTLASMLNGLDLHLINFRNNVIGLGIRIAFVYLAIPVMGLQGYLIGMIISLVVVTVLDIFRLIKETSIHFNAYSYILMPIICCVGTFSLMYILNYLCPLHMGMALNTVIQSVIFFCVLSPLLLITKCVNLRDFKI